MAKHIKADGTTKGLYPANGKTFSLGELQAAVGGIIEIAPIRPEYKSKILLADEEGLCKPNPVVNIEASKIAGCAIVGDTLLLDEGEWE